MQWTELLEQINHEYATTFVLGRRYTTGEQGAFAVCDERGRQAVLKWQPDERHLQRLQQAQLVTEQLRCVGYPAPHYLFIGIACEGAYSVQLALAGSPLPPISATLIPRLLEMNALQKDKALPDLPDWHQEVVRTVLHGGEGYCLHTALQEHSPQSAKLLHVLQKIVVTHQRVPHRTNDVVHGDFQHANILVHEGQISGIVDWDAPYAGDHTFDIATLLFYTYDDREARKLLWNHALQYVSRELLSMYLVHLILRQTDWSLRYHDKATAERYLHRADAILRDIGYWVD